MRDINLKEYVHLTPQERTNLTILALARGDFKEADRLSDACPRHSYRMLEKEYACRMMAIPTIKHLFYEQCVYYYNILVKIDYTVLLLEYPEPQHLRENLLMYDNIHHRHDIFVGKLKAVYQGLMQFCDQAKIDGDAMLKTICVDHTCFNIKKYLDSDIAADQEHAESTMAIFLECWQFKQ